jgi:hypothetical protein
MSTDDCQYSCDREVGHRTRTASDRWYRQTRGAPEMLKLRPSYRESGSLSDTKVQTRDHDPNPCQNSEKAVVDRKMGENYTWIVRRGGLKK